MTVKFRIGDTVYLTARAPEDLRARLKARARVVVEIKYDPKKRCCYYYLGTNHKSEPIPWLRSYMLRKEKIGRRQRAKRKYTRRTVTPFLVNPATSQGTIEPKCVGEKVDSTG